MTEMNEEKKSSSQLWIILAIFAFVFLLIGVGGFMVFRGVKHYIASQPTTSQAANDDDKAPAQPQVKDKPKSDANDKGNGGDNNAVEFHNYLLGFISASRSPFKKIDQTLQDSAEFAENENSKPDWGHVFILADKFEKIPGLKFSAPEGFSAEDKEFFNSRIKIVQDGVASLIKVSGELSDYYTAENYKDDWHKKFLMDEYQIMDLMDKISVANDEMFARSNAITEEIDRRNLAKTPYGIYVLNMREMLDKAKLQGELLANPDLADTRYGTGVSDEERARMIARCTPIADKAEALEKEMDEMAAKFKAVDREKIKGKNLEEVYDSFFKAYEAAKPDLTRIIRDLREHGYTNDQSNVKSHVQDLFRAHNKFVDILNGK